MAKSRGHHGVTKPAKVELPEAVREFFAETGRIGGKIGGAKGGKTSAERLTPEERKARASAAGKASAKVRAAKAKARREGKGE